MSQPAAMPAVANPSSIPRERHWAREGEIGRLAHHSSSDKINRLEAPLTELVLKPLGRTELA
ncbi:hypothetical protein D3C78_1994510 [compost metagenome]